jgi:serine/threonine protein phosphatase PrpC
MTDPVDIQPTPLPQEEGGDMNSTQLVNASTQTFSVMHSPSELCFLVPHDENSGSPSRVQVAAVSDVGCVRKNNEDAYVCDPLNRLYVVCDGMGGLDAGEVASSIACNTVTAIFASQADDAPIETRLAVAISAANDGVYRTGRMAHRTGMGTTMVAAALTGSKVLIGNVGDSRAYILQNGTCRQLTHDHSYINELVRAGTVKIEDLPNLDIKDFASVITRAIGTSETVVPDFFSEHLQDGDTILLTTDGLTRYLADDRIAALIDPDDLQGSCQALIDEAKSAGGIDNITCLLLRYVAQTEMAESSDL